MFTIYDGRDYFYQWDLDRKLIVKNPDIKEVHFCNRTDDCSLVCEVFEENGQRLVNVPNILLQTDWRIRAYAYDGNCTKYEEIFNVKARTKPADYVYTEVEIKNYEDLEKRIEALEENGLPEGAVEEAVEAYLAENPVEVDLSDYYNKKQVDEAISNVEVDLTGYATEKYVDDAIADIEISGGGDSGIHVGEEEPTGNEEVWIDPNGEPDVFIKTVNGIAPDANGNIKIEIPTVQDIINELPMWEGGEY